MAAGVNIAMLPEEHAEFWEYVATTGDIWACALADNPLERQYEPAPAAEFVKRFAKRIERYDAVGVYLGAPQAVLKPAIYYAEETVGGTKVRRPHLNHPASQLLRYDYGIINRDNVMDRTTTSFYSTYLKGSTFMRHPDEFLKWGRKVTAWLRRRIAGKVPVHRANYEIPATALAIEAVKKGLKVL